LIKIVKREGC